MQGKQTQHKNQKKVLRKKPIKPTNLYLVHPDKHIGCYHGQPVDAPGIEPGSAYAQRTARYVRREHYITST